MSDWKVDKWLFPIPIMAMIGFVIATFLLKDVNELSFFHLLFGFGLPALLMFPFIWKYGEAYRKYYH